ncbi:unnamed protein product [Phaedon cochleariae]|uniref:BESS domain-containing protein n=1 Tax=Phaedon cochleariae TaxID=80249 RepID=A0A9N9S9L6_PHACE|nr:unnamed protein product [Phaedon cochleariae]
MALIDCEKSIGCKIPHRHQKIDLSTRQKRSSIRKKKIENLPEDDDELFLLSLLPELRSVPTH